VSFAPWLLARIWKYKPCESRGNKPGCKPFYKFIRRQKEISRSEVSHARISSAKKSSRLPPPSGAKHLCAYVREYSCGSDHIFFKSLEDFGKPSIARRDIPSHAFAILLRVPLPQGPEYITTCEKAMLAAPETYCRRGEARPLTTTDPNNITARCKNQVLEAVGLMEQAWTYVRDFDLDSTLATKLCGYFEVKLVARINQKRVKSRKQYDICWIYM